MAARAPHRIVPSIASTEDTRYSADRIGKYTTDSALCASYESPITIPVRAIIAFVIAMCATATLSVYIISIALGMLEYPLLYISSAMKDDPMRAVSGFFYPLMCAGMALVFVAHSHVVRRRLASYDENGSFSSMEVLAREKLPASWFRKRNITKTQSVGDVFIGMSMLCFLATIAISLETSIVGHKTVAFILFLAGTIALTAFAVVDVALGISGFSKGVFKIAVAMSSLVSVCIMIVMSDISYLGGSICELYAVGVLVVYLTTYWNDAIGQSSLNMFSAPLATSSAQSDSAFSSESPQRVTAYNHGIALGVYDGSSSEAASGAGSNRHSGVARAIRNSENV